MSAKYLLCWSRSRVWLVGPFAGVAQINAWRKIGARPNLNNNSRRQVMEPSEHTLQRLKEVIYSPHDKSGYLTGAGI